MRRYKTIYIFETIKDSPIDPHISAAATFSAVAVQFAGTAAAARRTLSWSQK
jgi:hypothetical protein